MENGDQSNHFCKKSFQKNFKQQLFLQSLLFLFSKTITKKDDALREEISFTQVTNVTKITKVIKNWIAFQVFYWDCLPRYSTLYLHILVTSLNLWILWPFFMVRVQLSLGFDCRVTTMRQFTFDQWVPRSSQLSLDRPQKN